jgi:hypothetical protein
MSFSLKQEEGTVQVNKYPDYQKPGIFDNIRITEIKFGRSSVKGSPYVLMHTVGENGEVGKSNRMWLTTEKGQNPDGSFKSQSGWSITAKNIVDLICATHDMPRSQAELIELVPSNESNIDKQYESLVNTISTLLIGKPFRGKFKGEQSASGTVYATLDKVESMKIPKVSSGLRFSEQYDIKLFAQPQQSENAVNFGD